MKRSIYSFKNDTNVRYLELSLHQYSLGIPYMIAQ